MVTSRASSHPLTGGLVTKMSRAALMCCTALALALTWVPRMLGQRFHGNSMEDGAHKSISMEPTRLSLDGRAQ